MAEMSCRDQIQEYNIGKFFRNLVGYFSVETRGGGLAGLKKPVQQVEIFTVRFTEPFAMPVPVSVSLHDIAIFLILHVIH